MRFPYFRWLAAIRREMEMERKTEMAWRWEMGGKWIWREEESEIDKERWK